MIINTLPTNFYMTPARYKQVTGNDWLVEVWSNDMYSVCKFNNLCPPKNYQAIEDLDGIFICWTGTYFSTLALPA